MMHDELNQHLEDKGVDFKLPDLANTQLYSLAESSCKNEKWEQYVPDDTTILHTSNQHAVDKASYLALDSMQKQLEGVQCCHLDTLLSEVKSQKTKNLLQGIEHLKKSLLEGSHSVDVIKHITRIIKSLSEYDTSLSFLQDSFVDLLALHQEQKKFSESIMHLFCIYLGILKGSLILADLKHPFLDFVKDTIQLGSVNRFFSFVKQDSQNHVALAYLSETQTSDHAVSSNLNFECFSFLQSYVHQSKIVKKKEGSVSLYDEPKGLIYFMHFQRALEFIKDIFSRQNLDIFKEEMQNEVQFLLRLEDSLKKESVKFQDSKNHVLKRLSNIEAIHKTILAILKEETTMFSFIAKSISVFLKDAKYQLNPKLSLDEVFNLIWKDMMPLEKVMMLNYDRLSKMVLEQTKKLEDLSVKDYPHLFDTQEKHDKEKLFHQFQLLLHCNQRDLDDFKEFIIKLEKQKQVKYTLKLVALSQEEHAYLEQIKNLFEHIESSKGFDVFDLLKYKLKEAKQTLSINKEDYVSKSIPVYILEHFLLKECLKKAIHCFKARLIKLKKSKKVDALKQAKKGLEILVSRYKLEQEKSVIEMVDFPKNEEFEFYYYTKQD